VTEITAHAAGFDARCQYPYKDFSRAFPVQLIWEPVAASSSEAFGDDTLTLVVRAKRRWNVRSLDERLCSGPHARLKEELGL
jgi:hypothetical protein